MTTEHLTGRDAFEQVCRMMVEHAGEARVVKASADASDSAYARLTDASDAKLTAFAERIFRLVGDNRALEERLDALRTVSEAAAKRRELDLVRLRELYAVAADAADIIARQLHGRRVPTHTREQIVSRLRLALNYAKPACGG